MFLYFRFTLSLRDVEELLAQRGVEVSYETIRQWTIRLGPLIAAKLRRRRPGPTGRWHLDEVAVKIGGQRMWLWRAVDDEGVVLDFLSTHAAIYNCFAIQPHLISRRGLRVLRADAHRRWAEAAAAAA